MKKTTRRKVIVYIKLSLLIPLTIIPVAWIALCIFIIAGKSDCMSFLKDNGLVK